MHKIINYDSHKRKATFDFYKSFEDPFFNITCNIEVTKLYAFCKEKEYSFFLSLLHTTMMVANEIEEFKQRIVDDVVLEFDMIHPGATILRADDTFTFAYFNFQKSLAIFLREGEKEIIKRKNNEQLEPEVGRNDLVYFTSIPWISFTQFKHARSGKLDAIPRIVFGKYFEQGEKLLMPISIEVHHALIDGIHVGKFVAQLSQKLSSF